MIVSELVTSTQFCKSNQLNHLDKMKIFIGNLADGGAVTNEDIRPLFEQYGTVSECEVIKNYG